MKRRELIKGLTIMPFAGSFLAVEVDPAENDEIRPLTGLSLIQDQGSSLHQKAFVMDGHVHVMSRQLLQGLDIGQRYQDGTVDLPRIIEGGINALFFSVYTPEQYYPGRFEVKNTFRVIELALDQIEKYKKHMELALNASDIEKINRKGKIAAFLDLEGGYDMDGDLNLLRALYRLGLRSLQLTAHNTTNAFIDSCCDVSKWGGINANGRQIIDEMNKLGMVINVAHASTEGIIQTAATSLHPIIYSHGGFRSIVDHPRCITDEAAKAVASKGGVIGIHFGSIFNNPKYFEWQKTRLLKGHQQNSNNKLSIKELTTIGEVDKEFSKHLPMEFKGVLPDEYWMGTDQLAKVIDYGVRLVGEDHIALGSDFDGGPELPREMKDISDYPQITIALQNIGYSEKRIRKIMGLNWLRVIRQVTERS
jgi:membrane dipeptidase